MKNMTREQVLDAVRKIAPGVPPGDTRLLQAQVYVASLVIGTNADKIATFLQMSRDKVRRIAWIFRSEGVWSNSIVPCTAHGVNGPQPNDPDFWGKIQVKFALTGETFQVPKQALA